MRIVADRKQRSITAFSESARKAMRIAAFLVGLALPGLAVMAAEKPLPAAVLDTIASTIAAERTAQARGEQWERERLRLEEEIRQARLEEAWYGRQAEMFALYVRTAEARVAERKAALEDAQRLEAGLHELLTDVVVRLQAGLAADVPFLREERARRLDFLRSSLADYELSGAEKLRRVLDAMQAELTYGRDRQLAQGMEMLDGVPRAVNLVRAGRVGLYAVALDGSQAWRWTREHGFVALDDVAGREVAAIVDELEKKQPRTLPILPVDAAVAAPEVNP